MCLLFQQHGAKVVATDLSSTMINIALKRADESGITEEVTRTVLAI